MNSSAHAMQTLEEILGSENVWMDPPNLSHHQVDGMTPRVVVHPDGMDQVSEVVHMAGKENLTIVPWGSGSKMAIGNPPSRLDIVLCTKRLNKIVDMDTTNLTVSVQAGVRFKDLQLALATQENRCYVPFETPSQTWLEPVCSDRRNMGCFAPLTPPHIRSATVGGVLAADSAGPTRLLYGRPRDMVLGIRYVAPNGDIVGAGGKTVKNVSGYDLCKLMIGSMGSLGVLCEMTLRLLPLPERSSTCLFGFRSLDRAAALVGRVLGSPLLPAAMELTTGEACARVPLKNGPNPFHEIRYAVVLGLEGVEEAVRRMASELQKMAQDCGSEAGFLLEEDDHRLFWEAYSNLASELAEQDSDLVSVRLSYPVSRYTTVMELAASLTSYDGRAPLVFSQAGSGVSRLYFSWPLQDKRSEDSWGGVIHRLLELCKEIEGQLIIERASPELKRRSPLWGPKLEGLALMKRIKQELDPQGIFSPGRFVGGL